MNRIKKFRGWDTHKKQFAKDVYFGEEQYFDKNGIFEPENDLIILQQFTGLQDIKGKDIYEWDIIVHHGFSSKPKDQVIFASNGAFLLKRIDTLIKPECEVIGNIFENPELLENSKEKT